MMASDPKQISQTPLDQSQLEYLKTVLGVDRVVLPPISAVGDGSEKIFEIRGGLAGSRLIALVPLRREEFPLHGEAEALLDKMLLAMKLKPNEVVVANWVADDEAVVPEDVLQLLHKAGSRPVLVFGGEAAARAFTLEEALGQWGVWSESRLMLTFAPRELLRSPEKKRLTWVHLQAVMKCLGNEL